MRRRGPLIGILKKRQEHLLLFPIYFSGTHATLTSDWTNSVACSLR